jgi:LacI family transcriptional regulator
MFSTISEPQLTTVEVDVEEMSRMAIKFILGKISNQSKKYGRVMVKGRIVYRQSVKNILAEKNK